MYGRVRALVSVRVLHMVQSVFYVVQNVCGYHVCNRVIRFYTVV